MQHGPYVQYESNISLQEEEGHVTKGDGCTSGGKEAEWKKR